MFNISIFDARFAPNGHSLVDGPWNAAIWHLNLNYDSIERTIAVWTHRAFLAVATAQTHHKIAAKRKWMWMNDPETEILSKWMSHMRHLIRSGRQLLAVRCFSVRTDKPIGTSDKRTLANRMDSVEKHARLCECKYRSTWRAIALYAPSSECMNSFRFA